MSSLVGRYVIEHTERKREIQNKKRGEREGLRKEDRGWGDGDDDDDAGHRVQSIQAAGRQQGPSKVKIFLLLFKALHLETAFSQGGHMAPTKGKV